MEERGSPQRRLSTHLKLSISYVYYVFIRVCFDEYMCWLSEYIYIQGCILVVYG